MPSTNAMASENMWVHLKDGILNNCRTTHPELTDLPEEVDPEEAAKA